MDQQTYIKSIIQIHIHIFNLILNLIQCKTNYSYLFMTSTQLTFVIEFIVCVCKIKPVLQVRQSHVLASHVVGVRQFLLGCRGFKAHAVTVTI